MPKIGSPAKVWQTKAGALGPTTNSTNHANMEKECEDVFRCDSVFLHPCDRPLVVNFPHRMSFSVLSSAVVPAGLYRTDRADSSR